MRDGTADTTKNPAYSLGCESRRDFFIYLAQRLQTVHTPCIFIYMETNATLTATLTRTQAGDGTSFGAGDWATAHTTTGQTFFGECTAATANTFTLAFAGESWDFTRG